MTDFEKAERLCEKANVTFAEAKEALDCSGSDILDAMIYLENKGKASAPSGGEVQSEIVSTPQSTQESYNYQQTNYQRNDKTEDFGDIMGRFGEFCVGLFKKGLHNHLVATKRGNFLFSCPVLIVIILLIISVGTTLLVVIISMFCGISYHFTGDQLGKDSVNSVMDNASDVVEDVKNSFTNKK